jgi:Tol biopolymer transport system component
VTLTLGMKLGPYEITAPLGAGGMGEVYRARDTRLDRSVAIKVLPAHLSSDPDLRARFEREARVVSGLNHPHICTLHDIGHEDGVDYLVMEYLEGETLADRLVKGPLPLEQTLRYGVEIADALDRAHRAGVVHRDLKPGNVILTKAGAKLLDFGLAKTAAPKSQPGLSVLATEAKPLTEKGTVLGTVQYMAPEQLEGRDADSRTDIFAFGAMLYEMVTGRRAFSGTSQASLIGAILRDEPPPISQLAPMSPPALERVVRTCLAKDPEERWQSAHDLANELRWMAGTSGSAVGGVVASAPRRRAGAPLLIAGAVLAALAVGAALGRSGRRETAAPLPPAMRFLVTPAAEGSIQDVPALSPDGRSLAYVLTAAQGPALWIHSFETGDAKRIPGTEGAQEPFWSPDGKSIGFFARGQLRRVEATNGIAQPICSAADARGGSWSTTGQILFTGNSSSPLYRVPATGGVPAAVTELKGGEQSHRYPLFLPDGRHFLYLALRGDASEKGIYWGDVQSKTTRRVANDMSRPAYDARGFLLFVRQGTLVAQRFDAANGEASGDPAPLADRVGTDSQKAGKDWFTASPRGVIAYRVGGPRQGQLVWVDRTGRELGAISSPGAYGEPALAPDGARVAVRRDEESGGLSLWLYDTRSKDRGSRLTFGEEKAESPIWSADGTSVIFTSVRGGKYSIVRKAANGSGGDEVIYSTNERTWPDDISSDGRFLATEGGGGASFDVSLLPLTGDRKPIPFAATPANEAHAVFSPDARSLAYVSDESGLAQVYVQPVPPTGSKWQVSTEGGDLPTWSGDGKELYYIDPARRLMAVSIESRAPFTSGEAHALFTAPIGALSTTGNRSFYAPARDGKRFLVLSLVGKESEPGIRVIMNWRPQVAGSP